MKIKKTFKPLNYFMPYIVLLLSWIVFTGDLSVPGLLVGGIICILPLSIFPEVFLRIITPHFISRIFFMISFVLYLLLEVFLACYRIAYFAINRHLSLQSSVFAYEYSLDNNTAIFFLNTVITLTPGTLVLDIDKNKKKFYIHTLHYFLGSKEEIFSTIELMEHWIRRIFE